jgi:hypothetical protein
VILEPGNKSHRHKEKLVVDGNLYGILMKSKKDFLQSCISVVYQSVRHKTCPMCYCLC